jgi:hypothetical protein
MVLVDMLFQRKPCLLGFDACFFAESLDALVFR